MDEALVMHPTERIREGDRNAQKLGYLQWFAEESIERLAARVVEYEHCVPIVARERNRQHSPFRVQLACELVFVHDPRKVRWGL
jgi:hypothetical protein